MGTAPSSQYHEQQTIRTVSLGTIWRMLRYPFILLSALIIPRLMGDEMYGQYAFFMSVYLILDVLSDVGVTPTFGRFLPAMHAEGEEATSRFLHSMLFYGILITAGVILLFGLPVYAFRSLSFQPVWWLILVLLLVGTKVEGTLFAFLYGRNEIARYSMKELLRSAATFVLVVLLFHFYGLNGALWALVLNEAVLLVIGVRWTRDSLFRPWARLRFAAFKPYLLFGITFYLPTLLFGLLQRSGNLFIKLLTGSSGEVAYFDVANQFLLVTATFLGLIIATLLPSLTSLYLADNHEGIQKQHRAVMMYSGAMVFLAFHTLVLIGRPVIRVWLGPEFAAVYPNAVVLTAAIPPSLIAYVGMNLSLLEKRPGVYTRAVLAGMVVMTLASLLLAPRMRSVGVAWASVLGYAAVALSFTIDYRRQMPRILGGFWKVLLTGLLFVPFYFVHWSNAGAVLVLITTGTAYVALLLFLGLIRPADVRKVWAAIAAGKKPGAV